MSKKNFLCVLAVKNKTTVLLDYNFEELRDIGTVQLKTENVQILFLFSNTVLGKLMCKTRVIFQEL